MDIGSIFSGGLDALKSGLKGGISSIPNAFLNQALGMRSSAHAQNISMDAWREQNSTKYQLMADDLRRAGLNPILGVTAGLRGGGSGPSASPVYSGTGFSSAMDVKRAGFEEKESQSRKKLNDNMRKLNDALGKRYNSETAINIVKRVGEIIRNCLSTVDIENRRQDVIRKEVYNKFLKHIEAQGYDILKQLFTPESGTGEKGDPFFHKILINIIDGAVDLQSWYRNSNLPLGRPRLQPKGTTGGW